MVKDNFRDLMTNLMNEKITGEQLHGWYLEATKSLDPDNYNDDAQQPYEDLDPEQKSIDVFIADKIGTTLTKEIGDLVDVQKKSAGKGEEYMDGLANGLEVAKSVVSGEEPDFVDIPGEKSDSNM